MDADCARFRSRLPELLEAPADAGLSSHLPGCGPCARELAALRSLLAAAAAAETPGDPPGGYWSGFLPSVRERIEARGIPPLSGRALPGRPMGARAFAASALLMAGLAAAALLIPRGVPAGPSPEEAGRRLESLLTSLRGQEEDLAALLGSDWDEIPGLVESRGAGPEAPDPADVAEALESLEAAPRPGSPWDPAIERLVERLDAGAIASLREALAREEI